MIDGLLVENVDYQLITHVDVKDAWAIRILKGDFVETVVQIDTVSLEEENLSFNFEVVETPDPVDVTIANEDLQAYVGEILIAVIASGMESGYIAGKDRETGEDIEFTDRQTILRNLLTDEDFMRKVLPFIKPEYFEGPYRTLFKEAGKFVAKYNKLPTKETFLVELNEHSNLSNEQFTTAVDVAEGLFEGDEVDPQWLLENTEKWCQDRAIFNAVMESISIIDGKHDTLTKNALPDLLTKALGVALIPMLVTTISVMLNSGTNSTIVKKLGFRLT